MPDDPPRPPPKREPGKRPRPDFERFLGPLGKRWYDGGCVRSGCLLIVAAHAVAGLAIALLLRRPSP
ncbi:MAG TPA: hypothetical protein VKW04_04280 [Planctomycetota bacterium]|nr:hypothetical protein [Planctomycetota bacterium]